jgi:hypothetical protein
MWLQAAAQSRYTLSLLGEAIPGIGVTARDVFSGEELVLLDVNFSRSAVAGLTMASRLIPVDDFYMTGGAPLPVLSEAVLLRIGEYVARTCPDVKDLRTLPPNRATWLEAFIIRACRSDSASERVRYADP